MTANGEQQELEEDEPPRPGLNVLRQNTKREEIRGYVVILLLVATISLLAVQIIGSIVMADDHWERIKGVTDIAFTAFVGLLGIAVGWYFSEVSGRR